MPRPPCCRRIAVTPCCRLFKPAGRTGGPLTEVALQMDELEALRLADLEGLYQEQAAEKMNVSRQTFGRIVESARRKVAEALIRGKALRIEGGVVEMAEMRTFECYDCRHTWQLPYGTGRPADCPQCKSRNIHREVLCGGDRAGRGRCFRGGRQVAEHGIGMNKES